jgi:hypothetical protein
MPKLMKEKETAAMVLRVAGYFFRSSCYVIVHFFYYVVPA